MKETAEEYRRIIGFASLVASVGCIPIDTAIGRITALVDNGYDTKRLAKSIGVPQQKVEDYFSGQNVSPTDDYPGTISCELDSASEYLMYDCSSRHNECDNDSTGLTAKDMLSDIKNDTHAIAHILTNITAMLYAKSLDDHNREAFDLDPYAHGKSPKDGGLSRIIVTFESSDMTQEIGSADVSNDGIHATGVNLGINRIDKRINITDALKGIINAINNAPEVRR